MSDVNKGTRVLALALSLMLISMFSLQLSSHPFYKPPRQRSPRLFLTVLERHIVDFEGIVEKITNNTLVLSVDGRRVSLLTGGIWMLEIKEEISLIFSGELAKYLTAGEKLSVIAFNTTKLTRKPTYIPIKIEKEGLILTRVSLRRRVVRVFPIRGILVVRGMPISLPSYP